MSAQTSKPLTHLRRIKSFVLREGRLTQGQERALASQFPLFGLKHKANTLFDFSTIFQREAPVILEIGFGNGESLHQMALENPQWDFIGIEVHGPGVGNLLVRIEESGVKNIRVMRDDAVDVLTDNIPDASLDRLNLFFPDPWHKSRHHKRRLVQNDWLKLVAKKLKADGILHIATDWDDYARHVRAKIAENTLFTEIQDHADIKTWLQRPTTKFEKRGLRLGHRITDLAYQKQR